MRRRHLQSGTGKKKSNSKKKEELPPSYVHVSESVRCGVLQRREKKVTNQEGRQTKKKKTKNDIAIKKARGT